MRVLHISDLHIVPGVGEQIYGVDSFASLDRVLEAGIEASPDLIIATGDLVERGDSASYRRLRERLLATGLPVFVIPGNHDSPKRIAQDLCGDRIRATDVYEHDDWRFVFLDSRVPGEPYGALAARQLELLDGALAEAADQHVVVALHHTPIAPCPFFGCHLVGAAELLNRLAAHGRVRAVIAGHAHIEAEARFRGLEVITTPSTCAEAIHAPAARCPDLDDFWASHRFDPTRHGFRTIELAPDGSLSSKVTWVDDERRA